MPRTAVCNQQSAISDIMLFVVIIGVLVAFSYELPVEPSRLASPILALGGAAAAVVTNWLLAELFARLTVRRLRRSFDQHVTNMRSYQRMRWMHTTVMLASYVALIHGLDWPAAVRLSWQLERWVLVDELIVLAPFAASLLLSSLAHFRVEDLLRARFESGPTRPPRWTSRWSQVNFQLRHQLGLVLVPLLLLLTIQDVVSLTFDEGWHRSMAELVAGIIGLGAILIFAPVLLRLLWQAKPLPAGPLRERLERLGRRLRFRASDILIWNTRGAVINAAVAGILPWPRYVLLSDGLLDHLNEDEIEAVFGHEVGHVRHHHLWFFIAFLPGASLFMILTGQLLAPLMDETAADQVLSFTRELILPFTCLAAYFGIFFGFLSRRFERQADIFGCRAASCGRPDCLPDHTPAESARERLALCTTGIQIFVQALEKIAILNGAMRDTRSWRHFSIAKRVEFLQALANRPELERSFQRLVLLLKALVIVTIVALAGGVLYLWEPDTIREILAF